MSTRKIVVNFDDRPGYDVRVGSQLLPTIGEYLRQLEVRKTVLLVTDETVADLYADTLKESLVSAGFDTYQAVIGQGEAVKTIDTAEVLWEKLSEINAARDCLVVALGGGVVGDLAGFVAATYMRGVDLVQVPTTLLAMVDSSVGGKTGVNLPRGKNLVGAFKQPTYVCASVDTLATLPQREWACGCAEIAKAAVIDSDDFFFWLVENATALHDRDESAVIEAITRSIVFKADVVAEDETETRGVRECLNYGHTLGHAIETLAGYGTVSHGAAVAEGMRFAARLAVDVLGTSEDLVFEQDALLDALGLPSLQWSADPADVLSAMMRDKKVRSGKLRFVLPRDIGDWEVTEVDSTTVKNHLVSYGISSNK